jgi:hypothetical protein
MAEKKTKIDLKQRLAKGQPAPGANGPISSTDPGLVGRDPGSTSPGVPAPSPSAPVLNDIRPPVVGIPAPVLPATAKTNSGGGVPVPPFAPTPSVDPAIVGSSTNPFGTKNPFATAPPPEPKRPQRPQDIKIEVGAEAVEATKAMRKFIAVSGVAGVLVGVLLGMVIGGGRETSKREASVIKGASLLAQDVDVANGKIEALNAKLAEAAKEMDAKRFPENLVKDLGGISVPFDSGKLIGSGVGSYKLRTANLLFQYVADVQALTARKGALQGLFGSQKVAIKTALEQRDKPQIGHTMLVFRSPKGPVASVAPLGSTFPLNNDWPKALSINNLVTREKQEIARYEAGDFYSTQERRVGIPIEPESINAAFPNDISSRVVSELIKTRQLLNGTPGGDDETSAGLIKNGKELAKALREVGK